MELIPKHLLVVITTKGRPVNDGKSRDFCNAHYNQPLYGDRMTIANRITQARQALGMTQTDLATKMGVSPQAVQKWESGDSTPRHARLAHLATILKTSVETLLTGARSDSVAAQLQPISTWDDSTPLEDGEVELPFYREVELSGGSGSQVVLEHAGRTLRFDRALLRSKGITPSNAACVQVRGNSMAPILPDGTTVGVDAGSVAIKDGDMYAFDHDGQLRVKLLYRLPGGGIRVRSFNTDEHPDERYDAIEAAQKIRVIGRVFWYSVLL